MLIINNWEKFKNKQRKSMDHKQIKTFLDKLAKTKERNIVIVDFANVNRWKDSLGWAVGLKYTNGFTRLWPSIVTIVTMILSFYFLSSAVKSIPIGTAYAIWTGIGAVGTAILGIILFDESKEFIRIIFIMLIVVGIVGLKFFSKIPVQ